MKTIDKCHYEYSIHELDTCQNLVLTAPSTDEIIEQVASSLYLGIPTVLKSMCWVQVDDDGIIIRRDECASDGYIEMMTDRITTRHSLMIGESRKHVAKLALATRKASQLELQLQVANTLLREIASDLGDSVSHSDIVTRSIIATYFNKYQEVTE